MTPGQSSAGLEADMNVFSFLLLTASFVIALSSFRRGADLFSPGRVFGFLWTLALGLTQLKFSALQHSWSNETWVQVLIGPLSFMVGVFCMTVVHADKGLKPLASMRSLMIGFQINRRRLFWITLLFCFLFLLAYAIILWIKGVDPPLFSENPGLARREFTMFGLGLFLHNVVIVVFLTGLYYLQSGGSRGGKTVLLIASLVSVALYFFLLQRFQLAFALLMCIVVYYYCTNRLRPQVIVPFIAIVSALFYWVSTLRAGELFIYYLYRDSLMRFSVTYAMFTEPYMYVVMNLENLARSISLETQFTYGMESFDFLFALTGLKDWMQEYWGVIEMPFIISGYNTYTGYWTFYRDFGSLGTMVFPLLLGMGTGLLYYKMRMAPGLGIVTAYGVCVFVMVVSFFNNPLSFLWFVYNLGAVYLALRFIQGRKPQEVPSGVPQ